MWRKDSPLLVVVGVVTYLFLGPSSVLLDGLGQQYSLVLGHRAVLLQLGDYLEPRVKSWRKTVIKSGSRVRTGEVNAISRRLFLYIHRDSNSRSLTHAHALTAGRLLESASAHDFVTRSQTSTAPRQLLCGHGFGEHRTRRRRRHTH